MKHLSIVLLGIVTFLVAACASGADAPQDAPMRIASPNRPSATVRVPTATATATMAPATVPAQATFVAAGTTVGTGPSITITAVGDISLARQVNDWMAQYGASYPYELIQPLLTGDIVFGNLEGALTDGGEPWPKSFNFRTPPQYAPGLAAAGFDIVALANNHAMDYGVIGLLDTVSALNSTGVGYAGAGLNDASAWAPAVIEANGMRVAFIACALSPDEGSGFSITAWAAGETTTGMAVCSADRIAAEVQAARATNDFVLVSVHAGDEYVNAPNATQVALAEAALAAGADAFLGHHAHVVQPIEKRDGQIIAWGLSNFIFDLDQWDLAGIPEPRVSPILHITLTKGAGVTAWRADAVLLDADTDRPRPATPEEGAVLDALLVQ